MNQRNTLAEDIVFRQFTGFLKTPPLWTDIKNFNFPPFVLKDKGVPHKLTGLEVPPNLVLGKRAELFFHYFIEHFSEEEVLAANIQVISEKVTLGELDFILRNKVSKTTTHVEVVYKFYLYDPTFENEIDRWIGPNRKDSLVKKLSRLEEHQLPLLFKEETRPFLRKLKLAPEEIGQKVLFKANLFVPAGLERKTFPLVNNECIQGFWIRYSEFVEPEYGSYSFFSPKKPDWPIDPENGQEWFSYSEIRGQLENLLEKNKSPLVWMKKTEQEYVRFFVVWW